MDEFLTAVGVQAMRYAIRSGIALTSSYAIGQCSRLLKSVDDKGLYSELRSLQTLLDGKIKVISPAIDLVEFKSGRGNVFLASALPLAKSLQERIVSLGHEIEAVAIAEEQDHAANKTSRKRDTDHGALKKVITDIKRLLEEIDREIPLLQLAISASGESLSTSLPPGISPSRLLQASTLLIIGDTQYAQDPTKTVQIGPSFTLSIYMLFLGHATMASTSNGEAVTSASSDMQLSHPQMTGPETGVYGLGENDRKPLWQEVVHKARVRLCRSTYNPAIHGASNQMNGEASGYGPTGEYAYHLEVIEDLDDGRAHEEADAARPYDGISKANIREFIPIHQLSKMFYTDAGRILNIGNGPDGANNPVLLLKRDTNAPPPRADYDISQAALGAIEYKSDSEPDSSDQADIDRQLMGETSPDHSKRIEKSRVDRSAAPGFPKHLDPEWIALEVYEEDVAGSESSDTDDEIDDSEDGSGKGSPSQKRASKGRGSLDSGLISQIKNISLRPSASHGKLKKAKAREAEDVTASSNVETQEFVSRSPFGAIRTSLSLIEMLIRLAGLQEFQQASHLSIPDHILTFFLEETSTTGLTGEAMWKTRREAKKRMGFDPYTDSPAR
ncbi:Ran-specific GTPase-activating 30-like protein [Cladobotryum mycophilum]|uniref:Ran-specific GTPase-activating 30-like protein n=1 Tax=Cladobotryum mycophilum TaxID=491253 RepID=A0ABR0STH2_9HYPO